MITLRGFRYDGKSSIRNSIELDFSPEGVRVRGNNLALQYLYADISLQPRLTGRFCQLCFSDDSLCELENQPELDAALAMLPGNASSAFIYKLENNLFYIIIALVMSVVLLFSIVQYGVPTMARIVAHKIPLDIETELGNESLQLFDRIMQPSKLDKQRQQQLKQTFTQIADISGVNVHQILFRKGDEIGANAFALPSGIIVFTDEIVAMSRDDRELLAVFAHELGHVKHRHTMQHILQDSVTGLLLILLTGDAGTASSLAVALPTVLVQTKYSRDFENEADDFAIQILQQHNIDPVFLGGILKRIEEQSSDSDIPDFISTHPATKTRIEKFNSQKHN